MKNETNIFRLQCEPRSHVSREDHQTRLIEYDDRMRQEEKRYSQLLSELSKSYWFTRHVSGRGGFDQASLHKNDEFNSCVKYAIDRIMNEDLSSDIEATRLTDDEILYGGDLTLDQVIFEKKKSLVSHVDKRSNRVSTQHSMVYQYTPSSQERNGVSSIVKEITQASCDALESSGRESFPWESVVVESVRRVLDCWRGVSSFSSSERYSWNKDDINVIYHLSSE